MDTLELNIGLKPREPWTGILIAELSEMGFDGFVETTDGVMAYGPATIDLDVVINGSILKDPSDFKYTLKSKTIPYQNWNATWEAQFDPVFIEKYATIVAPFHSDQIVEGLKITIEPQMSFGTGHHQTTWLMTRGLFLKNSIPDRILDMGAGTGVLAIACEKLGAKEVIAVDIEEEAVKNIEHNAALNNCTNISAMYGDIEVLNDVAPFGLILANINKNVLKRHMKRYAELTLNGGGLWLSGFFESDVEELVACATSHGFTNPEVQTKEGWALIQLMKNE